MSSHSGSHSEVESPIQPPQPAVIDKAAIQAVVEGIVADMKSEFQTLIQ